MKHVSILIPAGNVSISNIEGTHQILSQVNFFLEQEGKPALFNIELVGTSATSRIKNGMFTIHADKLIDQVEKTDLIIIPAMQYEMNKALEANREFVPWIIKRYNSGADIASLCLGSFLVAYTGLLNGRKCSTHWLEAGNFRRMFPDVNLVPDRIVTDESGIYSSGGAYSSLNLILYLVEKFAGREMAIRCSKVFQIDIDRNTQSTFIIFAGDKAHDDESIRKAQEYIEANYSEKITVDELASMLGLSRRNLERRFRKVTSNSIVEYMQRVRIEAAKASLETNRFNVAEAMYKVGYADNKAFRSTFKKLTGLSPLEYRRKYSRMAVA